jgi:hypothetical protein
VWLDMELEGADRIAAGGQAYISIGRCEVVNPAPLMFCPEVEGGPNKVADLHDYTTVTCQQLLTTDSGWLECELGPMDVFHPAGKQDLRSGYPEINAEARTIKNMFEAEYQWVGVSKVPSMRKQVNCFFYFYFVVSCLI